MRTGGRAGTITARDSALTGKRHRAAVRAPAGALSLVALAVAALAAGCTTSSTGYNMDGVNAFRQGQPQVAVERFQQALAINPSDADSYYNLGATYHHVGKQVGDRQQLDHAEQLYNRCLDLSPDHVDCHRALAVLLVETGRSDRAFTLLERWVARNPSAADARIELARLYEEYGDRISAERYLTEAVGIAPQNARAWTALGNLRQQNGQLAQALSNYQQSYQLAPANPEVKARIAELQQRLGPQLGTWAMNPQTGQAGWTAPASNGISSAPPPATAPPGPPPVAPGSAPTNPNLVPVPSAGGAGAAVPGSVSPPPMTGPGSLARRPRAIQ